MRYEEAIDLFEEEMKDCRPKKYQAPSDIVPNREHSRIIRKCYDNIVLCQGDNIKALRQMPSNSVDAVCIDPPYGIGIMRHEWDNFNPSAIREKTRNYTGNNNTGSGRSASLHAGYYLRSYSGSTKYQKYCMEWGQELIRVMKPGAHMMSFCSPRMVHRLACGLEDAGFEVIDTLMWLFGSGMPKTVNISKAMDRAFGATREVIGHIDRGSGRQFAEGRCGFRNGIVDITIPASEEAKYWDDWGTELKPAYEPITLARKPITEDTICKNILSYGTGGMNIGACRFNGNKENAFPSNVIINKEVAKNLKDKARYFYCPKTPKTERHAGCEHFEYPPLKEGEENQKGNIHPTVKPVRLMEYLVRLITPTNGTCLDIFMGSGSTGIACANLGVNFIGVEREEDYFKIAEARITYAQDRKDRLNAG